jgi:hypothetical protein
VRLEGLGQLKKIHLIKIFENISKYKNLGITLTNILKFTTKLGERKSRIYLELFSPKNFVIPSTFKNASVYIKNGNGAAHNYECASAGYT